MSEYSEQYQWQAARGEKWSQQLTGMEAMLANVDPPLIAALRMTMPVAIADIGSGGGGTAIELCKHAPEGSVIHGFDVSPALIATARSRVVAMAAPPTFTLADVTTATPEQSYDRLVSRFGVMFFDDEDRAFANLARWLRPGGRFAFAVWSSLAANPWLGCVRDAVSRVAPMPPTPANAPGPMRYAEPSHFLDVLGRAGFRDLAVTTWSGLLPMGGGLGPHEAAHFVLSAFSSFSEILEAAGNGAFEQAHASLTAHYASHQQDGAVRLGACVHIVTGGR